MSRRAQKIEDRRHEQLLDRLDTLAEFVADVLDGALRLAARPLVVANPDGAADDSRLKEAFDHLMEALDAEKMSNAQLFSALYAQEQKTEMYRSGVRRAVAMARRLHQKPAGDQAELCGQLFGANHRLDRRVRLLSKGLRRVLRFAAARRADAQELNEWLQNALDEHTEAKAHARESRAQVDKLQAALDAERASVAKLQSQLREARADLEAVQGQLTHTQASRSGLSGKPAAAVIVDEFGGSPPRSARELALKGAIERQAEAKTKDQVRQFGAHVRALHERSILPAEIARRVNTDLGLSKSALSLYDVKRMLDHMGLGPR